MIKHRDKNYDVIAFIIKNITNETNNYCMFSSIICHFNPIQWSDGVIGCPLFGRHSGMTFEDDCQVLRNDLNKLKELNGKKVAGEF